MLDMEEVFDLRGTLPLGAESGNSAGSRVPRAAGCAAKGAGRALLSVAGFSTGSRRLPRWGREKRSSSVSGRSDWSLGGNSNEIPRDLVELRKRLELRIAIQIVPVLSGAASHLETPDWTDPYFAKRTLAIADIISQQAVVTTRSGNV